MNKMEISAMIPFSVSLKKKGGGALEKDAYIKFSV